MVVPESPISGAALIAAGVASLVRLARWRGDLTLAEPLVWSLHLGFAWVGVGLLLVGLSTFLPDVPLAAGLHALTVGAAGGMTLAVMTRAILGHTGRLLTADRWTAAIYLLIAAAACPSGRRTIFGRRLPPVALDLRAGMERRLRPLRRALRAPHALPLSQHSGQPEVGRGKLTLSRRVVSD